MIKIEYEKGRWTLIERDVRIENLTYNRLTALLTAKRIIHSWQSVLI